MGLPPYSRVPGDMCYRPLPVLVLFPPFFLVCQYRARDGHEGLGLRLDLEVARTVDGVEVL